MQLDSDTLGKLASEAIFNSLTQEKPDELLKEPITKIMAPEKSSSYGGKSTSILQDAFTEAVRKSVHEIVRKHFAESEEIRKQIESVTLAGVKKALDVSEEKYNDIASSIASIIARGFDEAASRY